MGYMHIDNLPKNPKVLTFKWGYALEKVHGTSAHVSFKWVTSNGIVNHETGEMGDIKNVQLTFFHGGESRDKFLALFDEEALKAAFIATGILRDVTVYGEAYGGKQQKMSHVYGPDTRFIAFDVKHGDRWLDVPSADRLAVGLGFEFVPWQKIDMDLDKLDALRDSPSEVSVRRGMNHPWREGIVLRPPFEVYFGEEGGRIIAKHKRPEAQETKTPRNVGDKALEFANSEALAEEWVTEQRLEHALSKPENAHVKGIEQVKDLIAYMVADVLREGEGEVTDTKANRQAIGKFTVKLFKERLEAQLREAQS